MRIILLYLLLFIFLSCKQKNEEVSNEKRETDLVTRLKQNDKKLGNPQPWEWLAQHKEQGQTFNQYKSSKPVSPTKIRNKIYLQPIGSFSDQQKKVIDLTGEYLQIYFGLRTIVAKPWHDTIVPNTARRSTSGGEDQLLAPFILDSILVHKIPTDAIVIMAITEKDLYPSPSWNYVFGLATLKKRVGVSSIFRYSQHEITEHNFFICLERLIKTSSHEIGHMFGMRHCINAECVMNGSNGLMESDSRPNRLCSECLHKLSWNMHFNNKIRLLALKHFFNKHKLYRDKKITENDLKLINR